MKTRRLSWKIVAGIVAGAATIIAVMYLAYLYPEIIGPIHKHARNTFGLAGLVILLLGAAGVLLFVTEKRKSEPKAQRKHLRQIVESAKALREKEAQYHGIFNSAIDSFLIFDLNGDIVEANPQACRKYGYPHEELIKLSGKDIVHPDYYHLFEQFKRDVRMTGEFDCESMAVRKDGTTFNIRARGTSFDYGGKPHLLAVTRDITEHKRAEEEKKKLEAQLQRAQKMEAIGTLAGGIAHDFNNLLMSIQGNASITLFDIDATHPHDENLKNIEKQVKRGATLTRQLLGYARKGKYEIQPVDLNRLVEGISETFGRTRKGITIHRDLAENLFAIEADEAQIEQVLLNMYVNAGDTMPGGGDLILKTMNVTHKEM